MPQRRRPDGPGQVRRGRLTGMTHRAETVGGHVDAGFVTKDSEPEVLCDAIRTVAAGESLLSPSVPTNDEIAAVLVLSPASARTYVGRLMTKPDARDRVALVELTHVARLV